MDDIFIWFEKWYLSKRDNWDKRGISIEEAGLSEYGHQYWIKLRSEYGLGNIILNESNGIYWLDFEGGNYDFDVMYNKGNIEIDKAIIDIYAEELIEHIMRSTSCIS